MAETDPSIDAISTCRTPRQLLFPRPGRSSSVAAHGGHPTRQPVFLGAARDQSWPECRGLHRHVGGDCRSSRDAGGFRYFARRRDPALYRLYGRVRVRQSDAGSCRRPLGHHAGSCRRQRGASDWFRPCDRDQFARHRLGPACPSGARGGREFRPANRRCLAMVSPPPWHRGRHRRQRKLPGRHRLADTHRLDHGGSRLARRLSGAWSPDPGRCGPWRSPAETSDRRGLVRACDRGSSHQSGEHTAVAAHASNPSGDCRNRLLHGHVHATGPYRRTLHRQRVRRRSGRRNVKPDAGRWCCFAAGLWRAGRPLGWADGAGRRGHACRCWH